MDKIKVLFICDDNSLRSPMAEAWLNHLGAGKFLARSAGFEAAPLNPLAVKAMAEVGLDISGHQPTKVFDLYLSGELFAFVITLCHPASAERCPIFPGVSRVTSWPMSDPIRDDLPESEKMERVREIRDQIRERIETFIKNVRPE